ncbi:hypothetical protein EVAR_66866_1 [Eumeta japonica]|uniref:Uncharacterized protein n=1 Tax=Eumeta variegata TaxID=151549 RepID=A0A4C1ZNX6_EUMVA|nr:hypothetical protein EVAR_66866_1 [Eumeta japonica]
MPEEALLYAKRRLQLKGVWRASNIFCHQCGDNNRYLYASSQTSNPVHSGTEAGLLTPERPPLSMITTIFMKTTIGSRALIVSSVHVEGVNCRGDIRDRGLHWQVSEAAEVAAQRYRCRKLSLMLITYNEINSGDLLGFECLEYH